jgi:transposase
MKDTFLSFAGQVFYLGIDIHLKSWTVTIKSSGLELKTFRMDPIAEQLAAYLHHTYPGGIYKSAYEAGFCGFWIHHKLIKLGIENIVVNPADIATTLKEKQHKCDPRDSRKIARELESNNLTPIYVYSVEDQTLKSLCRLRITYGRDMTTIKNRVCGYVHLYGQIVPEGTKWTGAFITKLETLSEKLPNGETLKNLVRSLKTKKKEILDITRDLKKALIRADKGELLRLLRTIPGIGFLTAATFITEISDLKRFRNFNNFAAFVGLIPCIESSDDKEKVKGLSKRKNKYLMRMIVEASWVAIRKDPVLLKSYTELSKRMKKQKAIIRIAKKLLNRVKAVWLKQTEYKICTNV